MLEDLARDFNFGSHKDECVEQKSNTYRYNCTEMCELGIRLCAKLQHVPNYVIKK